MKLKKLTYKYGLTALGAVAGGTGGWLYQLYAGCENGTCPITSSPLNSALWGAFMGALLFSLFRKENENR